jgi:hypothetical protein
MRGPSTRRRKVKVFISSILSATTVYPIDSAPEREERYLSHNSVPPRTRKVGSGNSLLARFTNHGRTIGWRAIPDEASFHVVLKFRKARSPPR